MVIWLTNWTAEYPLEQDLFQIVTSPINYENMTIKNDQSSIILLTTFNPEVMEE